MTDDSETPPASLLWVEELVNTRSLELGTDELATPPHAAEWLQDRGLLPTATRLGPAAHRRLLQLREGLRALIVDNNEEPDAPGGREPALDGELGTELDRARADLARLAQDLPLVVDVTKHPPRLTPRATGSDDAALASLLAAVAIAVADGSWRRLKACRDPGCRWAYYDHSRNRSRAWCSMASCGNRAKARAFRQRTTTT
jgi:hypothetical protein